MLHRPLFKIKQTHIWVVILFVCFLVLSPILLGFRICLLFGSEIYAVFLIFYLWYMFPGQKILLFHLTIIWQPEQLKCPYILLYLSIFLTYSLEFFIRIHLKLNFKLTSLSCKIRDSFSLNRWLQINLQRHGIAYKEAQKKHENVRQFNALFKGKM